MAETETLVIEDSSESDEENDKLKWEAGILPEAIMVLRDKLNSNEVKTKICSLLIGEVNLTQQVVTYKGRTFGLAEGISVNEAGKTASKALIVMVVSLQEAWKIPVALFFTHNPLLKDLADKIEDIISELNNIGIEICSITLNCNTAQLSFNLAVELGAEINFLQLTPTIQTHFKHPNTKRLVYLFFDLSNILASLKTLWTTDKTLCRNNQLLHYSVCLDVRKIQETDLGNYKLTNMYDWIIIRKRLYYDPEIIGKTTADAMHYLRDLGHPDYVRSGATIQFLKLIDWMCQFSQIGTEEGCFPALSEYNAHKWEPLVIKTLKYIKSLRRLNKVPSQMCALKTYVIGITIYFTSILDMYSNYVKTNNPELPYLQPSRFSLKHITDSLYANMSNNKDMTALCVYQKVVSQAKKLNPIKTLQ